MEFQDRALCGWRVRSSLPLAELPAWQGDDRLPEVEFRLGPIPEAVTDPVHAGPLLQIARDGTCRLEVRSVAAYLVEGGNRVTVQLRPGVPRDAPDVRVFLFGTVLGILCHQRGLLPLHASCVRIGDVAVAFAGPSGIGKSTLAAAFLRRGHPVLSDDVTVVSVADPGGPRVLPAVPRLKLWRPVLQSFGLPAEGLERSRAELDKFHVPVGRNFNDVPLRLAHVYHVESVFDERFERRDRLRGAEAVTRLAQAIYRAQVARLRGREAQLLALSTVLAGSLEASWRFQRALDMTRLDATVRSIAADCGAG